VLIASAVVWGTHFLPIRDTVGTPVLSPLIAMVTAGLLAACGIFSGIGPARRAAALHPAEALRT
jgi:ABC-type antimicrobial peptide transport system permease subunit